MGIIDKSGIIFVIINQSVFIKIGTKIWFVQQSFIKIEGQREAPFVSRDQLAHAFIQIIYFRPHTDLISSACFQHIIEYQQTKHTQFISTDNELQHEYKIEHK